MNSEPIQRACREFIEDFLAVIGTEYQEPAYHDMIRSIIINDTLSTGRYTDETPVKDEWYTFAHFARCTVQWRQYLVAAGTTWTGAYEDDVNMWAWPLFDLLVFMTETWLDHN